MKYIEYIYDEHDGELTGIETISLVYRPAHGAEFIAMGDKGLSISAVNTEQRLVIGPVMIPGVVKGTPARGRKGGFAKDTITRLMRNFVRKGGATSINHADKVEDCYFTQHWQVDRENGMNAGYGFDDGEKKVRDGTWMGSMFIGPDDLWMDCKKGDFGGFSVEGSVRTSKSVLSDSDYHTREADKLMNELFK